MRRRFRHAAQTNQRNAVTVESAHQCFGEAAPPTSNRTGQENFHRPGIFVERLKDAKPDQLAHPKRRVTRSCSIRSSMPSAIREWTGQHELWRLPCAAVNGMPQPFA